MNKKVMFDEKIDELIERSGNLLTRIKNNELKLNEIDIELCETIKIQYELLNLILIMNENKEK